MIEAIIEAATSIRQKYQADDRSGCQENLLDICNYLRYNYVRFDLNTYLCIRK